MIRIIGQPTALVHEEEATVQLHRQLVDLVRSMDLRQ